MRKPDPEVFRLAIEILKTRGWVKGTYRQDKGFCLVGAINQAQRTISNNANVGICETEVTPEFGLLEKKTLKLGYIYPHTWNDAQHDQSPVIDLLSELEREAREEASR